MEMFYTLLHICTVFVLWVIVLGGFVWGGVNVRKSPPKHDATEAVNTTTLSNSSVSKNMSCD